MLRLRCTQSAVGIVEPWHLYVPRMLRWWLRFHQPSTDSSPVRKTGRHRSLGVHVTFVRSVTMDVWKDRELKAMQAGPPQLSRSAAERAAARHAGGWQRSAALVPRRARSAARPQHREQRHHASGRSARPPPFPTSAPGLRSALPHLHRDVEACSLTSFAGTHRIVPFALQLTRLTAAGVTAARVLRSGARATQARGARALGGGDHSIRI